jgi:hypothetical protein
VEKQISKELHAVLFLYNIVMSDGDEGINHVQEVLEEPFVDDKDTGLRSPLLANNNNNGIRQRSSRNGDIEAGPRILDRNATFHQSRGRWGVDRLSRGHRARRGYVCCCLGRIWNEWIMGDWFHRLVYQRTCVLMSILFVIYSSIVVFFGFVYLGVSTLGQKTEINPDGSKKIIAFCDMDINDHMEALYFSLSTMTTIGYGVSDYYFGGCWTPLLLVLWQVCSAITFQAVAVGLLFHRISRGRKRGRTIAFSDKAVIRRIKGVPHLMFRIGELRRYHLIEATVRCYCVRHERLPIHAPKSASEGVADSNTSVPIETTHFVSRQVKLLHPDENYASHIWMGLPQVIVHRMDESSPLIPASTWYDAEGMAQSYPRHMEENYSHHDPLAPPMPQHGAHVVQADDIEHFLLDRDFEIVVLVEGTDEGTGSAMQARHSYKVTDLAWNHTFVSCVYPYANRRRRSETPVCSIDFSRFHDIVAAPEDCDACAYVPQ